MQIKLRDEVREKDIKRFLSYVEKTDTCWIWRGSVTTVGTTKGYGVFSFRRKTITAHRFSYFAYGGDLVKGHHVDHLCRNKLCVNPEHLEMVTHSENLRRGFNYIKRNKQLIY